MSACWTCSHLTSEGGILAHFTRSSIQTPAALQSGICRCNTFCRHLILRETRTGRPHLLEAHAWELLGLCKSAASLGGEGKLLAQGSYNQFWGVHGELSMKQTFSTPKWNWCFSTSVPGFVLGCFL